MTGNGAKERNKLAMYWPPTLGVQPISVISHIGPIRRSPSRRNHPHSNQHRLETAIFFETLLLCKVTVFYQKTTSLKKAHRESQPSDPGRFHSSSLMLCPIELYRLCKKK